MSEKLSALSDHAKARLGDALISGTIAHGELTLIAERSRILDVLTFLRDDAECRFVSFIDITAADYPEREKRFDVVYHLPVPLTRPRVRV